MGCICGLHWCRHIDSLLILVSQSAIFEFINANAYYTCTVVFLFMSWTGHECQLSLLGIIIWFSLPGQIRDSFRVLPTIVFQVFFQWIMWEIKSYGSCLLHEAGNLIVFRLFSEIKSSLHLTAHIWASKMFKDHGNQDWKHCQMVIQMLNTL